VGTIIAAAREHRADAIGMSGLLVKSTVVMRENLAEIARDGLDLPVILGGAALTRKYVEEDCTAAYASGRVAYARDAFDGLDLMAKVAEKRFDDHLTEVKARRLHRPTNERRTLGQAASPTRPIDYQEINLRRAELARQADVPTPPFWGAKIIDSVPLQTLVTYLNDTMLYQFQWGYKKAGRTLEDWRVWASRELKPMTVALLKQCEKDGILQPKAAYGYWKCASLGDSIVLFDEDGQREVARFAFPRQAGDGGLCIADFVRDIDAGERDVIGLQVVTMGHAASEVARQWFAENRYKDYLHLHGLSVEMAEALAEYVHTRIRAELGFGGDDDRDIEKLLRQGYRGSRYSFGYPACPNVEDQAQLLALLRADRIGVTLSEEWQLEPEQSTSAIVLSHPQAKYFSV
jgi:5-methyltetrahydrofolate--homocysteine methyltransferase